MTNEKIKEILLGGGVSAMDVKKIQKEFNLEKISEITGLASAPREAYNLLHETYPNIEIEKVQEECELVSELITVSNKKTTSWKNVIFGVAVDFCVSSCVGKPLLGGFALNSLITDNAA